jgi:hypothetical protein
MGFPFCRWSFLFFLPNRKGGNPLNRPFPFIWMSLSLWLIVSPAVFAADAPHSRLVPSDRVIVYQGGKKIAEYTQEMPVPEGTLLSCTGSCLVKLDDIAVVAEDQSQFGVDSHDNSRHLSVREGTVYFGISAMPRPIVFLTPQGAVSAGQVILNASSGTGMLEGYVRVNADTSEIGVIDGGRLHILTGDGQKILQPGQRFILAQADTGDSPSTPAGRRPERRVGGSISRRDKAAIAAGATALAGVAFLVLSFSGGSDISPSGP